jgi:hypothetical protein
LIGPIEYPMPVLTSCFALGFKFSGLIEIIGNTFMAVRLLRDPYRGQRQPFELVITAIYRSYLRMHSCGKENLTAKVVADSRDEALIQQQSAELPEPMLVRLQLFQYLVGLRQQDIRPK